MGILSGIFKARDKPSNATAGSAYHFLFGGSTSGKAVRWYTKIVTLTQE
ncbi:hypothetical protein [uncultured Bacteroides sp.]|nr:hypothetical protein [uncultured Bacteroides sp.]